MPVLVVIISGGEAGVYIWGVYLWGIFVGYICGVYLGCIFVGYFLGVERNPLRPAKKGVLAVLPAVGHGRGEEFDIKEVVASQCALHLFYHTSAIFQKGKQGFTNFHHYTFRPPYISYHPLPGTGTEKIAKIGMFFSNFHHCAFQPPHISHHNNTLTPTLNRN